MLSEALWTNKMDQAKHHAHGVEIFCWIKTNRRVYSTEEILNELRESFGAQLRTEKVPHTNVAITTAVPVGQKWWSTSYRDYCRNAR